MKTGKNENRIKTYCTGCGLCKSVMNTVLLEDKKGFYYPSNLSLEQIDFCNKVCPAISPRRQSSKLWGTENGVWQGWSNDPEIRHQSSSGGIITTCLMYILEYSLVDAIIHVGANAKQPWKTEIYIDKTVNELKEHSGSRYSISHPLEYLIESIENEDYKVAVVGRPCDIVALKNFLDIKPEYNRNIIYTFSFFCGGMPSHIANENMFTALGCNMDDVKHIQYRGNGWPGCYSCTTSIGSYTMSYIDSWGKILGRDVMRACRFCMDSIGEAADVSCGDAWYIKDNKPDFSNHDGRNIIYARTNAGKELLDMMENDGKISRDTYNLSELDVVQRSQKERKSAMLSKLFALKMSRRICPKFDFYTVLNWCKYSSLRVHIRQYKGTKRRIKEQKF